MSPHFVHMGDFALHPLPDGSTWQVVHELSYHAKSGSVYTVPVGFVTDLASIPRIFWRVLPPWAEYGPAAVVHDLLYATQKTTRAVADATLMEAMEVLEVAAWKRNCIYYALRAFGSFAWKADMKKLATTAALLTLCIAALTGCATIGIPATEFKIDVKKGTAALISPKQVGASNIVARIDTNGVFSLEIGSWSSYNDPNVIEKVVNGNLQMMDKTLQLMDKVQKLSDSLGLKAATMGADNRSVSDVTPSGPGVHVPNISTNVFHWDAPGLAISHVGVAQ